MTGKGELGFDSGEGILEGLEKFRMLSAKVAKKGMFELLGKQFQS